MTGNEFTQWRNKRGLTQPQASGVLDFSLHHIRDQEQRREYHIAPSVEQSVEDYEQKLKGDFSDER